MSASPSSLGIAAAAPAPPQARPETTPLLAPPVADLSAPPAWSRPAQCSAALLLALALSLLAWHAYGAHRWSSRPTTLERGALRADGLDLNRADHAQLVQLPGVGDGLARRIVAYRDRNGGFRRVDDLRQVPGVGPVLLERLRLLVYVGPYAEEEGAKPAPAPKAAEAPRAPGKAPPARPSGRKVPPSSPIDINRAGTAELQRVPGIGPTLSQRIVEARAQKPFRSVDELRRVKGIGAKTLERLRPHLTVGAAPAPAKAE
jgi:competence protein ComEA